MIIIEKLQVCKGYLDSDNRTSLVQFSGDLENDIKKVDNICGNIISDNLAVITASEDKFDDIVKDIPSITFIETPSIYFLQESSPLSTDNINKIVTNKYLGLDGENIIVGIVDTGLNYLNKEFINEDDTTRILSIWDQSIQSEGKTQYIGTIYEEDEINYAIKIFKDGGNPYNIVPSKDEIGHGTHMASIIGARGYNKAVEGIAKNCKFCVVKLLESPFLKKFYNNSNSENIPIYNSTEVFTAIDYILKIGKKYSKAVVIYLGVGSQDGSHDGNNLLARFLERNASVPGVFIVSGTGNQGNEEGHFKGIMLNVNDVVPVELNISREMKLFTLNIWIQRPNRMNLSITSPQGEVTGIIKSNIYSVEKRNFFLSNTKVKIKCMDPENFTGNQLYELTFTDIKPGIWKFSLIGVIIANGRFDIWLPNRNIIPEGTKFLKSTQQNTLSIPSTVNNVISIAYVESENDAILGESGKGFNTNGIIKPDIAINGTNIITTSINGESVDVVSGSSVATAIGAGACALLAQWGLEMKNDLTLSSSKLRSLLIYSAKRPNNLSYPSIDVGYGLLDLENFFFVAGGNFGNIRGKNNSILEKVHIQIPSDFIISRLKSINWEVILNE